MKIRSAKAGGCNDWFVPSVSEIEKLRKAVESRAVSGEKLQDVRIRHPCSIIRGSTLR